MLEIYDQVRHLELRIAQQVMISRIKISLDLFIIISAFLFHNEIESLQVDACLQIFRKICRTYQD